MTDTSAPDPLEEAKKDPGLLAKIEAFASDLLHGGEHVASDAEHAAETVAPVAEDVAAVAETVDPALAPEVTAVEDAGKEVAAVVDAVKTSPSPGPVEPAPDPTPAVPTPPAAAGIDSTVQQGNRVASVAAQTPESPVALLTAKITSHFDAVVPYISTIRATLDAIETELNKLRTGL